MPRHLRSPSIFLGRLASLISIALVLLSGTVAARADSCAADRTAESQVSARLPLYDLGETGLEGRIRSWTRGDPGTSVGHEVVADGADGRMLRVSFQLDSAKRAEVGIGVELDGLDASAYDHLELRVRGDPIAGYPRSFAVAFLRPRPDRPEMMESASHLVQGVGDDWVRLRVPLNLMDGIRRWQGLDEFVIAFDSRRAEVAAGAIYVDDVALVSTGRPGPSAFDLVPTPQKALWEQARGGKDAARGDLVARLRGWPEGLLSAAPEAADDRAFLMDVARATWRGLAALVDREHGIPIDHVAFAPDSVAPAGSEIGDYTSPTNLGIWLMAVAASEALGLIDRSEAIGLIEQALSTMARLERIHGFFYNFYDTTTLERSSNFVSSVDAAWLTAGLMVVRSAYPELGGVVTPLIEESDYGWLYDDVVGLMNHGYYANLDCHSAYHYGLLYTEARVLSLIAIGKGDVPEAHWFRLQRTLPAEEAWQSQTPRGRVIRQVRGHEVAGGWYERDGQRYVPSWGGSMFEALMPVLVVDEIAHAPESLGRNDQVHAMLQQRHALEELAYPVWGMSPSATVGGGYGEFGVRDLGVFGYPSDIVTPHASALALAVMPDAATQNLRALVERYAIYGAYGFYDAVDPRSGEVALRYLTLDQGMVFLAIANHLTGGVVQRLFAADPIAARVLPMLADERFFDDPEPAAGQP